MAQDYTIAAVAPNVRDVQTKFGAMKSYKLKLVGVDDVVEILQKAETPSPQADGVLHGHIEDGQYGKKFKKEARDDGGFGNSTTTPQAATGFTPPGAQASRGNDPFTMYLSYAKDIAVAMIADGKLDEDAYGAVLETVATGAKTLYNDRPGAEPVEKKVDTGFDPSVAPNAPATEPDADSDEAIKKKVDDFFADLED